MLLGQPVVVAPAEAETDALTVALREALGHGVALSVGLSVGLTVEDWEEEVVALMVGLVVCDSEGEPVVHGLGLVLTVVVGLRDAVAQELLLCVPDTLTLDEELTEGLNVPVMLGLTLNVEEVVLERHIVGLPLTVEVGLSDAEAQ